MTEHHRIRTTVQTAPLEGGVVAYKVIDRDDGEVLLCGVEYESGLRSLVEHQLRLLGRYVYGDEQATVIDAPKDSA